MNGSASANVTIEVTDETEPPSAPATPTVTATADTGRSLEVTWNEPTNTGPTHHRLRGSVSQVSPRHELRWHYTVIHPESTERKVTITTIPDTNNGPRAPGASNAVRGARAGNERRGYAGRRCTTAYLGATIHHFAAVTTGGGNSKAGPSTVTQTSLIALERNREHAVRA